MAAETSTDLTVIETIADGYSLSMRRDDPARYGLKLLAHLEFCAKNYCGAGSSPNVYSECADFVMTHYGHLGVDEIRQAFGLAAAGKLSTQNDEPVNIRAYHGAFTVLMLGDLLAAYDTYRRRLLPKIVKLEIEAYPSKQWDSEAWGRVRLARLRQLAEADELTMDILTEADYDHFSKSGAFRPDEEARRAVWEQSHGKVKTQIAALAMTDRSMRNLLQHITNGLQPEDFKAKRIGWSKRKLLYDWLKTAACAAT